MTTQKSELVAKSNRLIEASYRLGLVEQQMILFSIVQCREQQRGLSADHPVKIRAQDFAERFGIDSTNVYRQMKEGLDALYKRDVRIYDEDESGSRRVVNTRWISDKAYIDGTGTVELTFAPKMIPFITRLEREFTTYRLEKIGRMSSAHAVRLYELLIQYLAIGQREIEIEWLKEVLQVKNEYPRITDLKKRVIDVAVNQINEHSDLLVDYEQRKTGRVVTHLVFKIRAKPEPKPASVKKPGKTTTIDRGYVEKHARPGETYDQAYRRLLEEAGQKRLDV